MGKAASVKDAAITVRVPLALKRRLAERAKREHRSISAQVQLELERAVAEEPRSLRQPAMGMFEGARVPTEDEIREVRSMLFGLGGSLPSTSSRSTNSPR